MIKLKSYTLNQLNNYCLALVGVIHYLPTPDPIGHEDITAVDKARKLYKTSFPLSKHIHPKSSVVIPIGVKLIHKRYQSHFIQASFGGFNVGISSTFSPTVHDLQRFQENPEKAVLALEEDFPLLIFWNLGAFYNKTLATAPTFKFVLKNSNQTSKEVFTLKSLYKIGLFHSVYSYKAYQQSLEHKAKPTFVLKHFGECKVPKDNNFLFGALNRDYTFSYLFCQDNPKYDY
nr:MAG: hypothetical protein [Enquatrovirus sp.]